MEMPTFATEQYPKGLGATVPELEIAKFNIVPHSKTCFTMIIPELLEQMNSSLPLNNIQKVWEQPFLNWR